MSYKITVLKISINKAPGKNYNIAEVAYKTEDGKTKGMKVLDFVQKDVFAVLTTVNAGDVLNADFEQNAKGFWQFAQVSKTGEKQEVSAAPAMANSPAPSVNKGNWETSDERAARQVMIVRQSSLSNTINYFELTGHKKATPEDVIAVSKLFEAFVMGKVKVTGEVE